MIDLNELERLWQSGETGTRLAKRYGVSYSHIYKLRKRHRLDVTLRNGSHEPGPATAEDGLASAAGLDLAPWVARRVAVLRAAWAIAKDCVQP
jgi:hypothetical protein